MDRSDSQYFRAWDYESLTAAVDGDGNLISLVWLAPLKVTETIAEEDKRDGALTVTGVQLGLFRIREQNNTEAGLLIPAWFFTGTFAYGETRRAERAAVGFQYPDSDWYDAQDPLLIVNAIDGSIIDPWMGY